MHELSDKQLEVIRMRDKNILVSAAAGSGKTRVLVERIIGRLKDETDPIPMPMKQKVSTLECSFKWIKLTMVPAIAQSHTNENNDHPQ